MNFNPKNIERIRTAFENIGNCKWEAGDAALAEVPADQMGRGSDVATRVATLADLAGVSGDALQAYRQVAASWPAKSRIADVSWSVHREVMGLEHRVSLIQDVLAEHGKVTVDLVRKATGKAQTNTGKQEATQEQVKEAVAKAKAEAEAEAAEALAKTLAQQELKAAIEAQKASEAAEKAKQQALREAELKQKAAVEAERKRVEAAAKQEAEAAAKLKLQEIEARLREEIKAEPPTPEVLAEMAKQALTSSDPNVVNKMAEAYGKHRVEQDAKNKQDAQARQAAARAAQAERDAQNAEKRASKEYEDSALKLYIEAHELMSEMGKLLRRKPITFSNITASRFTISQIQDMVDEDVEIVKAVEANCLRVEVEGLPVDVR